MSADVLVVGAGPVGLALALHTHAHGAQVRIVDRRSSPRPSRALVVHPRALEQLRPLGVLDDLRRRALDDPRAIVHLGHRTVRVRLDDLAVGDRPVDCPWLVRQRDVEDVLARALERDGVPVTAARTLRAWRPGWPASGRSIGQRHPRTRTRLPDPGLGAGVRRLRHR